MGVFAGFPYNTRTPTLPGPALAPLAAFDLFSRKNKGEEQHSFGRVRSLYRWEIRQKAS